MITLPEEKFWQSQDNIALSYYCHPGIQSDYYFTIIHGFAEHSGRYSRLVDRLKSTGRPILVYDLRGHGRSGGKRGALETWTQYWEDFRGLTENLKKKRELPEGSTVILGHSLGGLIALDGALRDGKMIKALILSSPCLGLALAPGLRLMNTILSRVTPNLSYSKPVHPDDLSRDSSVCQAYKDDPLILKSIRAKTLELIIQAGNNLESQPLKLSMPVWFLAAGNERVVDLKRTLSIYAKLDAPFKKLKILEGFRHEIFNEVRSEIAYDIVLQAIEQIHTFSSNSRKTDF